MEGGPRYPQITCSHPGTVFLAVGTDRSADCRHLWKRNHVCILEGAITPRPPRHLQPRMFGLPENSVRKKTACEMVPLQNVRPNLAKDRGSALLENQANLVQGPRQVRITQLAIALVHLAFGCW